MRLLIVGAGSTGGYLGARLIEAGRDVTFLVRPGRAARLRETGLSITSPHGDVTVHPKILTADALHETYDAILLAVKDFQLVDTLEDIAPAVGPQTMILPVLNGMRHMRMLAERFTPANVVGCALKVATTLDNDGRIIQLSTLQDLSYGELDGSVSPRIRELDAFLQGGEIGARLSTTIHREMWEKWILLAATGALTCLLSGTVGEIEACHGGTAIALGLIDEVVTIVRAVGEAPSEAFLENARGMLTAKGSSFASSMYRDVQNGRPVEVEAIVGDLVRHAEAEKIASPLLSAAYVRLLIYRNRIAAAA